MKTNRILVLILILSMLLCVGFAGCAKDTALPTQTATEAPQTKDAEGESKEAAITLTVDVVDSQGNTETFSVSTDADNLADALIGAQLVEGENGAYGLYIKSVNGIRADYDLDGAYWALYSNGELLMTGAGDTPIADGEHYELVYTAG